MPLSSQVTDIAAKVGQVLIRQNWPHRTKGPSTSQKRASGILLPRPNTQGFPLALPVSTMGVGRGGGCGKRPGWCLALSPGAARTQHTLAQAAQLQVGILEGILHLLVQRLLLALEQDGAAAVQDPLGGPLHHQQVPGLGRVGVLVNGQLERKGCSDEKLRRS